MTSSESSLPRPGSLWRYRGSKDAARFRAMLVATCDDDLYLSRQMVVYEDMAGGKFATQLERWLADFVEVDPQMDLFEESGW